MAATDDLLEGLHELSEAAPTYQEAADHWDSTVSEWFASNNVRRALGKSAGRYQVAITSLPVVALTDRLKVGAVTAVTENGVEDEEANQALTVISDANQLTLQYRRIIRSAILFGDCGVFYWPGDQEGSVSIRYKDPRVARPIYDPSDELTIKYVIQSWEHQGRRYADLWYPDRLELGWVLKDGGDPTKPVDWTRQERDDANGDPVAIDQPHDYGWVPYTHFRTDLPYGRPEARFAFGPQAAINKASTTMAYSTERAGLRDRYLLTDPNATLNGGVDNPDWDDDLDTDETLEGASRLDKPSGPGGVDIYEGIKTAGEWSAPDPAGFTHAADWWTRMAAMLTQLPSRYADPGGQHPSGSALRAADAPLASKAEDRRDYLDHSLKEVHTRALTIAGYPDRRVDVRWKPAGFVDDVDTWQIVQSKIASGVPAQVALTETGLYDNAEVAGWLSDAPVEMDVARRINLLYQVSGAFRDLGEAVSLGLATEAQVKAIVDTTLGQLAPEVTGDVV